VPSTWCARLRFAAGDFLYGFVMGCRLLTAPDVCFAKFYNLTVYPKTVGNNNAEIILGSVDV
jgi:hypothetical protein